MPRMTSIAQQDSVMNLNSSNGSISTVETNESGFTLGGTVFMRDLHLVQDNFAGTRLDEVAPSVNLLLNTKNSDKRQERW